MTRRQRRAATAAVACVGALAAAQGVAASGASASSVGSDLAAARSATAAFHRVASAEAAGFGRLPAPAPLHECIDEDVDLDDQDGTPAMGIHWINGGRLDGTVDASEPEVLVYEPTASGRLRLVALEYVVFEADWHGADPPSLFGHEFMHVDAPNRYDLPPFYALHAWAWKHNPDGTFVNMNPTVSCAHAGAVS